MRSALNARRIRTDPCSPSHIISGSGKVAALRHLGHVFTSDGLRCQWGAFAKASFQAVANHSLLFQDSHPQRHNCVQVVCRELASDINKLVSSFKCLREPMGVLQARDFVFSFGLRFYDWTQQGTAEMTRRSGCTSLVLLCSRDYYSPPLQLQGRPAVSDVNFL